MYIVFDGDVDTMWVEDMNSVMDDNRLLTLANGERIRLQPHCALLFEVGHLQFASPATVSRCGMVYVDPKNLSYQPLWACWLATRSNHLQRNILHELYVKYLTHVMDLILTGTLRGELVGRLKTIVPLTAINLIAQFCHLLEVLIPNQETEDLELMEAVFLQTLCFGIGGSLMETDQKMFDECLKSLANLNMSPPNENGVVPVGQLPDSHLQLADFMLNVESRTWVPWEHLVPAYEFHESRAFFEILVPTKNTVSISWLLAKNLAVSRPTILVGENGSTKTASVNTFLQTVNLERYVSSFCLY